MGTKTVQIIVFVSLLVSFALDAQTQHLAASGQTNAPAMQQINQSNMPMMQHMQEGDSMSKSMTDMADTCQMMMQKEMRAMPVVIAAGAIFAALLIIALLLFIVLEIQWIRFWKLRISTAKQNLAQSKPS